MSETIARYYDETKNPDTLYLDGVPLRDLMSDEFDALPAWLQASVDACGFYRKTKPPSIQPTVKKGDAHASS